MSPARRPISDVELLALLEHRRPASEGVESARAPSGFADHLATLGLAKHGVREQVLVVERFAAWCAERGRGPFALERDLSGPRVEEFLHHEEFFGLSPATIASMLVALRHLAAWARGTGRISARRAAAIEHLHRARAEEEVLAEDAQERGGKHRTPAVVRAMLEAAHRRGKAEERAVLALGLLAGLSPLELPGLWRADLLEHPDRLELRVPLDPHRAARTVPLASGVARILREALAARRGDGPQLLRGARGPLEAAEVRRLFARHARPLGVEASFLRAAFPRLYLAAHPSDRVGLKALLGIDGRGAHLAPGSRRLEALRARVEEAVGPCVPE